jgi:hypothetical protein
LSKSGTVDNVIVFIGGIDVTVAIRVDELPAATADRTTVSSRCYLAVSTIIVINDTAIDSRHNFRDG